MATHSREDGRFEVRDVVPGYTGVCARLEGHAPSPKFRPFGSAGDVRELELRLQGPAAGLAVTVLGPDGEPVEGARVRVRETFLREGYPRDVRLEAPVGWNGTTDADGRCTATSLTISAIFS